MTYQRKKRGGDFYWTKQREEAASLCAAAEISCRAIATKVGISYAALNGWKITPAFDERVEWYREQRRKMILSHGIARQENRVAALQKRWLKLCELVEKDPTNVGLHKECRAHERQCAQELNGWVSQQHITGSSNIVYKEVKGVSLDDL